VGPLLGPVAALELVLATGAGRLGEPHFEVSDLGVADGRFAHLPMISGRVVHY
jgi:hypothetical protein